MQLWVSKLNKNKWKITLIILSVALVTSCIFGVTTAWFNNVDNSKANVSMDMKYVDIFASGSGDGHRPMIPGQYYDVGTLKIDVNESKDVYCVFMQLSELGGAGNVTYLDCAPADGWIALDSQSVDLFQFPKKNETKYFYQIVDAEQVAKLDVLQPTDSIRVLPQVTYDQIKGITQNTAVMLEVVAAGCKTTDDKLITQELPTAEEVAFAEVNTAFF